MTPGLAALLLGVWVLGSLFGAYLWERANDDRSLAEILEDERGVVA